MNTPKQIANHVPLTQEEATKLAGAYQRIVELQGQSIKTPTQDAELSGLLEYIANALLEHANEFIGCWFAVRTEYEPLIGLVSRISSRVTEINQRQAIAAHLAQQQAAAAKSAADAKPASNIVTLDGAK